jgi:hypothetical protein
MSVYTHFLNYLRKYEILNYSHLLTKIQPGRKNWVVAFCDVTHFLFNPVEVLGYKRSNIGIFDLLNSTHFHTITPTRVKSTTI